MGMAVRVSNASTQEAEVGSGSLIEASLVCAASCRPASQGYIVRVCLKNK